MPTAALRYCAQPGCGKLVEGGMCDEHRTQATRDYDARRGTRQERGYGARWYRATAAWLAEDPMRHLCADPYGVHGAQFVQGTETDHIIPHRGDYVLFWQQDNWQRLCKSCHSRKTIEGG